MPEYEFALQISIKLDGEKEVIADLEEAYALQEFLNANLPDQDAVCERCGAKGLFETYIWGALTLFDANGKRHNCAECS